MREIFTSRQSKNQRNIQVLMIFLVVIAILLMDSFLTLPYATRSIYKVLLFLLFPVILGGSIRWFDLFSVFRVKSNVKKILPRLFLGLGVYGFLILLYVILKDVFNLDQIMGALESSVAVTKDNFLRVAIYISFVNSFLEEFFFRGFAYLKLKDKMPKIGATVISATAFSIYHYTMVKGWASPILVALGLLGLFLSGIIFNIINDKNDNIYSSYAVHVFANLAINTIGLQMFGLINLPFLR